ARRRLIEVEERLRGADREPGELDEGPVRVEARARDRGAIVVHAELQVAAQSPVLGLLPAVEPRIGAGPQQEVVPVEPVLLAGDAGKRPVRAARTIVIKIFTTNISADLEADIGARDVVEAVAVKAADLHVWHRRCLDRQVGGLRLSDRNQSRGRPEEKTFHHLHLNLHVVGAGKWPFSVKFTRNLLYEKFTWVTGDGQGQRGHFEDKEATLMQFSAGCCRNNTSFKAAAGRWPNGRWPKPRPRASFENPSRPSSHLAPLTPSLAR